MPDPDIPLFRPRHQIVGPRIPAGPGPATEPRQTARVLSREALTARVATELAGKFADDPRIHYGDSAFYLPTLAEVQQILAASQLDRKTWLQDRFDSEGFAHVLKGEMSAHAYEAGSQRLSLCFGLVCGCFDWSPAEPHTINWVVTRDEYLRLVDPWTDDIYPADRCTGRVSWLVA